MSDARSHEVFARLLRGEPIADDDPDGPRLREACDVTRRLLLRMNAAADPAEIRRLLGEITGQAVPDSVAVFTPLYINYGRNTHIGKNVFINFDCVFLDLGGIRIGDGALIGPRVSLLSEGHPLAPAQRHALVPGAIHIGRNAWIGAGATVLAGVTVGENAVVAASAVVRRDVPANAVVGGIPARLIKTL